MAKYSPEKYIEAKIAEESARFDNIQNPPGMIDILSGRDSYDERRLKKARAKLEQLKNSAHGQALELEQKHRQLLQSIADAQKKLLDFERQELGMDNPENDSETKE